MSTALPTLIGRQMKLSIAQAIPRPHMSSARPTMFVTASTWIGCAANSSPAISAIRLELMRLLEKDDAIEKAVEDYCWGV